MINSTVSIPVKSEPEAYVDTLYISKRSTDIVAVTYKCFSSPVVGVVSISVSEMSIGNKWEMKESDFLDKYEIFTGSVTLKNKNWVSD